MVISLNDTDSYELCATIFSSYPNLGQSIPFVQSQTFHFLSDMCDMSYYLYSMLPKPQKKCRPL